MAETQALQSFKTVQYLSESNGAIPNNSTTPIQNKSVISQTVKNTIAATLPKVELEKTPKTDTISLNINESKTGTPQTYLPQEQKDLVAENRNNDKIISNKYLGIGGGIIALSGILYAVKGKWGMKESKQLESKGQELLSDTTAQLKNKTKEVVSNVSETVEESLHSAVKETAPKPVSKSEAAPDIKVETTTEINAEPVQEVKIETAPETKVEATTKIKTEPVQEVKIEPAPEPKVETTTEINAEPVQEVKIEPAPETKVAPIPETKIENTSDAKVELTQNAKQETIHETKTEDFSVNPSKDQVLADEAAEGLTMPNDIETDIDKIFQNASKKDILDTGGRYKYITVRNENGQKIREYTIDTVDPNTDETRFLIYEIKDFKPGENYQFRTISFDKSGVPYCVTDKINRFKLLSNADKEAFRTMANKPKTAA